MVVKTKGVNVPFSISISFRILPLLLVLMLLIDLLRFRSQVSARVYIGVQISVSSKSLGRQEPIWSVQLPYSVCETAFSQVGLFLD